MLMHLSLGHVTLLAGEFLPAPLKFFLQSDLGRRVDSRWALAQISSQNCATKRGKQRVT